MSAKGRFLVLRRYRAGDEDFMLKVYGSCGMARLFVSGGILPEAGYLGLVEPFNLLYAVYKESGDTLFLKDVLDVQFLSYLSLKDHASYMWMSSVASFVERWFFQYDPELFEMAVNYLTLGPKNQPVFLLKFKLEFLKRMGLYKEEVFEEGLRKIVEFILKEGSIKKLERLKVPAEVILKSQETIEVHLSSSL